MKLKRQLTIALLTIALIFGAFPRTASAASDSYFRCWVIWLPGGTVFCYCGGGPNPTKPHLVTEPALPTPCPSSDAAVPQPICALTAN